MHPFVKLMKQIESSGTFSAFGKMSPIFPGLVIQNVGEVSLPLSEHQAKEIVNQCEQAPFGRKEETIIDTNVRNVWQVPSKMVELSNPEWNLVVEKACKEVANKLGLSDCKVHFELYKVLLYAKGSFFKEHRDTEKIPNMFATMVINLPSTHEGGELIIRHGTEQTQYSFAGKSKFYPEFAAFYADCYHEVLPIQSGFRLSLIYNLAIANRVKQPALSQQEKIIDQINTHIQAWSQKENENLTLTYLLDHSYSEQNLAIENLKNHDFAKASILFKLAQKNQCKVFLCLVSYFEESYGDCWNGEYEECEVTCQEVYAHHFISPTGEKIEVEELVLEEDQILAEISLRKGPGREISISEATGNEGATKELWYHRGAIIMWPERRDLEIIFKSDIAFAIHHLKKLIKERDVKEGENRKTAIQLAHHIINNKKATDLQGLMEYFITLGDVEILNKMVKLELQHNLTKIPVKTLVQILNKFSWSVFTKEIHDLLLQHMRFDALKVLAWLHALLLEKPTSPESQALIIQWFQEVVKSLITIQEPNKAKHALAEIFKMLIAIENQQIANEVIASISNYKQPVNLFLIYAPAVLNLIESHKNQLGDLGIFRIIAHDFSQYAQEHYSSSPIAPISLTRIGQIACPCDFCKEVNKFLPDPNRSNLSFEKVLQRDMLHIETKIKEHHLDLTIRIERQPPKFKGAISKNQHSYEQALKRFELIEQAKRTIEEIFSFINSPRIL